ncbi:hypothetical protein LTR10_022129 [Elasticomyces elasticus]|uniref:Uncharacterized protein n=1 Tax=Exophiala sideris TaxID=1016849 RepID=A0ABR0J8Q3_9EURO|nr:hypothetical protein LTR10_022129 [Elasticomyces elasticus]KAK5029437.1 hypothetical protein LTS07_005899 [Exophiala sideris]KAK5036865.1 hypothetical protein LTR13_005245 [Exophiala sideris]KAK5058067.1 hypothetical protein LTR69_007064 [Exophiala sideris]KAK5182026.1 hypothetical protein LTR44_005627 [Eurotiomycetes sp. CCFEE 6388]
MILQGDEQYHKLNKGEVPALIDAQLRAHADRLLKNTNRPLSYFLGRVPRDDIEAAKEFANMRSRVRREVHAQHREDWEIAQRGTSKEKESFLASKRQKGGKYNDFHTAAPSSMPQKQSAPTLDVTNSTRSTRSRSSPEKKSTMRTNGDTLVEDSAIEGYGDTWEAMERILDQQSRNPDTENSDIDALANDSQDSTMDDIARYWSSDPKDAAAGIYLDPTDFVNLFTNCNVVRNKTVMGGKNPSLEQFQGFVEWGNTRDKPSRFILRCPDCTFTAVDWSNLKNLTKVQLRLA